MRTGLGLLALGSVIDTNLQIQIDQHNPSLTQMLDYPPAQTCMPPKAITLAGCFLHGTAHNLSTGLSPLSQLTLNKSVMGSHAATTQLHGWND
jgi:hypothetical protein